MSKNTSWFIACFFILVNSCGNTEGTTKKKKAKFYAESSVKVIQLSSELEEVSDICYLGDNKLGCIQDEKGKIYIIDANSGAIITKYKFAGEGDFEGVAFNGKTAFAATSDGTVYTIKDFQSSAPEVSITRTGLTEFNNVEGLFFDKNVSKLLLVCKNKPGNGLDLAQFRSAYLFDPKQKKLDTEPVLKMSLEKIFKFAKDKNLEVNKKNQFHPSAISIHPVTQHYFVIASSGQLMVEFDRQGEVIDIAILKNKIFPQPEGIAFDEKGGLFISNEAKEGPATIIYYPGGKIK